MRKVVEYTVKYFHKIDVWGRHGNFAIIIEVKFNSDHTDEPDKIRRKAKSSLVAAEDIVRLLPGKKNVRQIRQ